MRRTGTTHLVPRPKEDKPLTTETARNGLNVRMQAELYPFLWECPVSSRFFKFEMLRNAVPVILNLDRSRIRRDKSKDCLYSTARNFCDDLAHFHGKTEVPTHRLNCHLDGAAALWGEFSETGANSIHGVMRDLANPDTLEMQPLARQNDLFLTRQFVRNYVMAENPSLYVEVAVHAEIIPPAKQFTKNFLPLKNTLCPFQNASNRSGEAVGHAVWFASDKTPVFLAHVIVDLHGSAFAIEPVCSISSRAGNPEAFARIEIVIIRLEPFT